MNTDKQCVATLIELLKMAAQRWGPRVEQGVCESVLHATRVRETTPTANQSR